MARNPYTIIWLPAAPADLLALNAADEKLADAALAALDDIAHHRQRGKLLGKRNVSGDLTGLYRLRFDVPGQHPPQFRIVYRLTPAHPARTNRIATATHRTCSGDGHRWTWVEGEHLPRRHVLGPMTTCR